MQTIWIVLCTVFFYQDVYRMFYPPNPHFIIRRCVCFHSGSLPSHEQIFVRPCFVFFFNDCQCHCPPTPFGLPSHECARTMLLLWRTTACPHLSFHSLHIRRWAWHCRWYLIINVINLRWIGTEIVNFPELQEGEENDEGVDGEQGDVGGQGGENDGMQEQDWFDVAITVLFCICFLNETPFFLLFKESIYFTKMKHRVCSSFFGKRAANCLIWVITRRSEYPMFKVSLLCMYERLWLYVWDCVL